MTSSAQTHYARPVKGRAQNVVGRAGAYPAPGPDAGRAGGVVIGAVVLEVARRVILASGETALTTKAARCASADGNRPAQPSGASPVAVPPPRT